MYVGDYIIQLLFMLIHLILMITPMRQASD